jgi:hypothetical protein
VVVRGAVVEQNERAACLNQPIGVLQVPGEGRMQNSTKKSLLFSLVVLIVASVLVAAGHWMFGSFHTLVVY